MSIIEKHWREKFSKLPAWICGECQEGTLGICKGHPIVQETPLSLSWHQSDHFEIEHSEKRFMALMECTSCADLTVVSGDAKTNHCLESEEIWDMFYPRSVHPATPMFAIHKDIPTGIACRLREAFALFWPDKRACANRLRTCAEEFLRAQPSVIDEIQSAPVGKWVPLGKMIEWYEGQDQELADALTSVKWIGNDGSHHKGDVGIDDLLHCVEVLQLVLETKYLDNRDRIVGRAHEINKRYDKRRPRV